MGDLAQWVRTRLRPEPREATQKMSKQHARQVVDAQLLPYFQELLARWEAVASQPVDVANHAEMIEQVGRQNTYRAIVAELKREFQTAERILAQDAQRQRSA